MRRSVYEGIVYCSLTMTAACVIAAATVPSYAQTLLPQDVPIPHFRPITNNNSASAAMDLIAPQPRPALIDTIATAFATRMSNPIRTSPLASGLNALSAKNIDEAINIRNFIPENALDRKILTWAIATSGDSSIALQELSKDEKALASWPNQHLIASAKERAIIRDNNSPAVLILYFNAQSPQTVEGMHALATAYIEDKQEDKATALLNAWWPEAKLSAMQEKQFLTDFGKIISRDDHRARLFNALYTNRIQSAEQLATAAQARELVELFKALGRNSADTAKRIATISSSWRDQSIYQFAQIRYLRINGQLSAAAALMQRAPKDKATLINPDAWWNERRILSRDLMDIGQVQLAYKIVADHAAETPAMAADAEFHAGWYALRMLNDTKLAVKHFKKLEEISTSGQSLSRAYYWLARTAEAGSDDNSEELYRKSAQYRSHFYGQLAAAKLEEKAEALPYPIIEEKDKVSFYDNEVVQAIRRLEAVNYGWRANSLYLGLARQLNTPGELALLAAMAENNNNHYLSLRIGKIAASRGIEVGALTHPTGAIPANAVLSETGLALTYAIARQESEFNVGAVSHAGALGLLQLMPATAKSVATRAGLAYSQQQLTQNAAYNATLGSHYLTEQLDRFEGSYILTASSYNAGPNRAGEWVKRYGNPSGKSLEDVIDWIERIPYPETRNYVQRVMENYEVYRLKLHGKSDIVHALRFGRS